MDARIRIGRRDAVYAGDRKLLSKLESNEPDDPRQQEDAKKCFDSCKTLWQFIDIVKFVQVDLFAFVEFLKRKPLMDAYFQSQFECCIKNYWQRAWR